MRNVCPARPAHNLAKEAKASPWKPGTLSQEAAGVGDGRQTSSQMGTGVTSDESLDWRVPLPSPLGQRLRALASEWIADKALPSGPVWWRVAVVGYRRHQGDEAHLLSILRAQPYASVGGAGHGGHGTQGCRSAAPRGLLGELGQKLAGGIPTGAWESPAGRGGLCIGATWVWPSAASGGHGRNSGLASAPRGS